jgi:hypothetical protein
LQSQSSPSPTPLVPLGKYCPNGNSRRDITKPPGILFPVAFLLSGSVSLHFGECIFPG